MREDRNGHPQSEDNGNDEHTLERFRQALETSAPPDGLARLRTRVRSELAAQRSQKQPSRIAPTRIAATAMAAAAVVLAAFAIFTHPDPAAIACPHGDEAALKSAPPEKLKELLSDPDHFPRICSCSPAYSGELRMDAFELSDPTRMTQ